MKTFFLASVGCVRNMINAQRVHDCLVANGFGFIKDFRKADILIVDTCGFSNLTEERSFNLIKYYLGHNLKAEKVIIIGCLPKINPDILPNLDNLYVISSKSSDLERIDELLEILIGFKSTCEVNQVNAFPTKSPITELQYYIKQYYLNIYSLKNITGLLYDSVGNRSRHSWSKKFHIKVAEGCLGTCTFCAIKHVWGKLLSRPMEDILKEFKNCLDSDAKTIYLETHDLGAYGLDINLSVVDLLRELYGFDGNYKLILNDFNPHWLLKYFSELITILTINANRISYINIPLQSGSNRILRLMKRPYVIEDVKEALIELKSKIPRLSILFDIMIGFPDETEEDFLKTREFIYQLNNEKAIFWLTKYSDRPNTPASMMDNKIKETTMNRRLKTLMRDKSLLGRFRT